MERSNKELDDFTHIVSHDLKEPLRGIRTYSNMLIDHYDAELNATGHAHLRTLVEQTNRLDKFISSLLQYSQIRMTEPAIKKTNVHILLTEIVDSLRADLEQLGVEIRIPKHLPTIICDRVHMGEVFKNLVSNAIKFNDKSQKWVEVSCLEDLDSAPGKPILEGTEVKVYPYIFYVRDNGIGIRPRHLESIFAIFKRLHGREQFEGGTGAGLTIVKKIIERHGGQIWIESTYGEGTTFYFTWQGG